MTVFEGRNESGRQGICSQGKVGLSAFFFPLQVTDSLVVNIRRVLLWVERRRRPLDHLKEWNEPKCWCVEIIKGIGDQVERRKWSGRESSKHTKNRLMKKKGRKRERNKGAGRRDLESIQTIDRKERM